MLDPRCIWLGCTIRAAISQIDHLQSHIDGGSTDAANAAVMCRNHNQFKSCNGYHARRDQSGDWTITRPDGSEFRAGDAA